MNILEKYSLEISVTSFWVTFLFLGPFAVGVNNIDFMVNTGGLVWIGILVISLFISYIVVKLIRKTNEKWRKNIERFFSVACLVSYLLILGLADGNSTFNKMGIFIPSFVVKGLSLVTAILGGLFVLKNKPFRRAFLGVIILFMQTVGIVNSTYLLISKGETVVETRVFDKENWENFSQEENQLLIIVDSLRGDFLAEALADDLYSEKLKDFIAYPDTIAAREWTVRALPFILSGKYMEDVVTIESSGEAWKRMPEDMGYSVFQIFADNDYSVDLLFDDMMSGNYGAFQYNTKEIIKSKQKALSVNWFLNLPEYFRDRTIKIYCAYFSKFFTGDIKNVLFERSMTGFEFTPGDKRFLDSLNMRVNNERKTFKYTHLFGTHSPIVEDINGKALPVMEPRVRELYINRTKGILNDLVALFEQLKKLGIYDKTMITIVADHGTLTRDGKSIILNGKEYPFKKMYDSHPINPNSLMASVGLIIKPFDSNKEIITIDDAKAYNGDVAKTLADSSKLINEFEGYNLLNSKIIPQNRARYFLVPERGKISKYKLTGEVWDPTAWSKVN